jgi:hypothetical protein
VPTDTRVLRGGSFNNNQNNVRCAYRNNRNPNNRNNNNGFRIVVSTLFCKYAGIAARLNRFSAEAPYDEEWMGIFLAGSFTLPLPDRERDGVRVSGK